MQTHRTAHMAAEEGTTKAQPVWPPLTDRATILTVATLVALGIALRLLTYLRDPSLSHDEAALALNTLHRSPAQLQGPLDYFQMAPYGFLVAEHFVVRSLGGSELALRLLPTTLSIASVLLFTLLAKRLLRGAPRIAAVGFFALSTCVDLCMTAKQYSCDVFFATWIALACQPLFEESPTPSAFVQSGIVGFAAPWFSFASVFVLGANGVAVLTTLVRDWRTRPLRRHVAVWLVWGVSIVAVGWVTSHAASTNAAMNDYWQRAFTPWRQPAHIPAWFLAGFKWLGAFLLSWRFRYLGVAVILAALLAAPFALRRRAGQGLSLLLPLAFCIAASALQRYPFEQRFLLVLVPSIGLLVFVVLQNIERQLPATAVTAATVALALLLVYQALSQANFVRRTSPSDPRDLYADLRNQWQPGDKLYLSAAATPSFIYYRDRFGFSESDFTTGRRPDSFEIEAPIVPLPLPHRRLWFCYFLPNEPNFDRIVLARNGAHGVLAKREELGEYGLVLWDGADVAPDSIPPPDASEP